MNNEQKYLDLLKKVLMEGEEKTDRTGTGTISIFGEKTEFDISNGVVPLLTTKKIFYKNIIRELLWFISGETSTKKLKEQGVKFWDGNTSREFLDKRSLFSFEEGELGAGYGFQWRHFGAEYAPNKGCDFYQGKGVDQLQNAIDLLKNNPDDRRIIISAWNPSQLDQVALPPCHCFVQFFTSLEKGEKSSINGFLDCLLYQRSADMFLGVPFNIASYAILTHMIGFLTGLKPRKFIHMTGDTHIYKNCIEQTETQLKRSPLEGVIPTLKFARSVDEIKTIDDFVFEDFIIEGYKSLPSIKGDMAI